MAVDVDAEEQLVIFRVMDEEYAVPIAAVLEIVRVPDALVRVPGTPHFIAGMITLRGAVLPVIDQRLRLGLAAGAHGECARIVVIADGALRIGLIVDSVAQVLRVARGHIGPAPALSPEQQRLIRRVVNLTEHKRMIFMLEVDQLLDAARANDGDPAAARAGDAAAAVAA